jgi:ABC-type lipoprotein release transport system permease subunit
VRAVRYGLRALRRRRRQALLPILTMAGGAALLTVVLGSFPAIRRQAAQFGDPGAIVRTTVAVSVLVVLVSALEVAICATRSVNQRRAEIGVLTANGVPPQTVLVALAVEPGAGALIGGAIGGCLGSVVVVALRAAGKVSSAPPQTVVRSAVIALALCAASSLMASILPLLRAVRKPPLVSLSSRI